MKNHQFLQIILEHDFSPFTEAVFETFRFFIFLRYLNQK